MDNLISKMDERLSRIEQQLSGARAVHMGNGRVLARANFLNLIYLVDGMDRLIVPRFIMDGVFEPDVTSFFLNSVQPDNRCLDIGTNFGYYTCMFARLASKGHTLGVEADPDTFEFVRDNIAINWLEGQATVLNVAASDADGELTLYRRDRRSGNTSIIKLDDEALAQWGERPAEPFTVRALCLDSLAPGPLDFLKIDVEGAEPLVFRGARRLIEQSPHLQIVMEWAPAQIKAAGFDPAAFTEDLNVLGLNPSFMRYDGTQTSATWAEVRANNYGNLLLKTGPG